MRGIDKDSQKLLYKIAVELMIDDGRTLWQVSSVFVLANTILGAFLAQNLLNNVNDHFIFYASLAGLLANLLWFIAYRRRTESYQFRMAQAKAIEKEFKSGEILGKIANDFYEGKQVIIDNKCYKLTGLSKIKSHYVVSAFIWLFIIVFGLLAISVNPLFNICFKNICSKL